MLSQSQYLWVLPVLCFIKTALYSKNSILTLQGFLLLWCSYRVFWQQHRTEQSARCSGSSSSSSKVFWQSRPAISGPLPSPSDTVQPCKTLPSNYNSSALCNSILRYCFHCVALQPMVSQSLNSTSGFVCFNCPWSWLFQNVYLLRAKLAIGKLFEPFGQCLAVWLNTTVGTEALRWCEFRPLNWPQGLIVQDQSIGITPEAYLT